MTGRIASVRCLNCDTRHTVAVSDHLAPLDAVGAMLKSLAVAGWLSWDEGRLCPRCSDYALKAPRGRRETEQLIGAIAKRIERRQVEVVGEVGR